MKSIVFTGGGTAGHVIPSLPLIQRFLANNWTVDYIGSGLPLESDLIAPLGVDYHAIQTGKLRRYWSLKNLRDAFLVVIGLFQAYRLLGQCQPQVIFSKGGYVAFPVVVAGWLRRIPVVAHESDLSFGLANKLSYPFVKKVCVTFSETLKRSKKAVYTGMLIRPEVLSGDPEQGRLFCGFSNQKPILLVMGGSQGAALINQAIHQSLAELQKDFQIAHICGGGNLSPEHNGLEGYRQFEFVGKELPDLFAASDLAISRAGSNSLSELWALRLPHLLIPLGLSGSRGDQLENAALAESLNFSKVLLEADLNAQLLLDKVSELAQELVAYRKNMESFDALGAVDRVEKLLLEYAQS